MKNSFRIVTATLAFVIGILAVWLTVYLLNKQASDTQRQVELLVTPPEGKVDFYFLECAGKRSVFILENGIEHSIYARVRRADFWKEFKDANLEIGLHLIEYKSPDKKDFVDVSGHWEALDPFKEIKPNSKVRYGVDLDNRKGEYVVKVPYIEEDAEVAQRLNKDFASIIKQDFERVNNSWKEVKTEIITNQCH